MIALFFKVVENGIVIIFSAFSSYGRVNFCYEMKDHRKALKLCTFDNCSMFSFLLMLFFFQSPLSPPSWCVPRVMRSSLLPGISVSMLSRNTASAYTKR